MQCHGHRGSHDWSLCACLVLSVICIHCNVYTIVRNVWKITKHKLLPSEINLHLYTWLERSAKCTSLPFGHTCDSDEFPFLVKSNNTGFCYTAQLNLILRIRQNWDGIKVVFAFYRINKLIQKGEGTKWRCLFPRLVEKNYHKKDGHQMQPQRFNFSCPSSPTPPSHWISH